MNPWSAPTDAPASGYPIPLTHPVGSRPLVPEPRSLNGHSDLVKLIDELPKTAVDAGRELLSDLLRPHAGRATPTVLAVTSPIAGEGVSFVSRTVAAVLAHDFRQRVCLVDLHWPEESSRDQQKRRKTRRWRRDRRGYSGAPLTGLAEVLRRELTGRDQQLDEESGREARRPSLREIVYSTTDPRMRYVAAGEATAAEAQVFARSPQLARIVAALARHHDHLVLDLPPVLPAGGAVPLAHLADAVLLVVRHGVTTEAQVRATLDRLESVPVAGVVLNQMTSKIPRPLRRRLANW